MPTFNSVLAALLDTVPYCTCTRSVLDVILQVVLHHTENTSACDSPRCCILLLVLQRVRNRLESHKICLDPPPQQRRRLCTTYTNYGSTIVCFVSNYWCTFLVPCVSCNTSCGPPRARPFPSSCDRSTTTGYSQTHRVVRQSWDGEYNCTGIR